MTQTSSENNGKVFGIGLPRTGTTSVAVAMLELGLKTCHTCFKDTLFDAADAFFDTPIYVDYPLLDRRYPDSKYILTWRDPHKWYASFSKNLVSYLRGLRTSNNMGDINRRCYIEIFGLLDLYSEDFLIFRYQQHRKQAELYFRDRPNDLLILDLDAIIDPWDKLCSFLDRPRPATLFPYLNTGGAIYAWEKIDHANKSN